MTPIQVKAQLNTCAPYEIIKNTFLEQGINVVALGISEDTGLMQLWSNINTLVWVITFTYADETKTTCLVAKGNSLNIVNPYKKPIFEKEA